MATVLEHETRDSQDFATRERLLLVVLFVVSAVAANLVYQLLRPFLPALAWALALSVIALPVHRWVSGRIHHRGAAAGLTVCLAAVLILGPALFVAQQVTSQAVAAMKWIQEEEKIAEWRQTLVENERLAGVVTWFEDNVDLAGEAKNLMGAASSGMTSWLTGSVWLVMQLLVMLLTLFFFLRDNERAVGAVPIWFP